MIQFYLNNQPVELDIDPQTPLLWAVREHLHLNGSKYGCGMGLCGACTMHLDGKAVRTCTLPIAAVAGKKVTTIEGLDHNHPVIEAWVAHDVPQCGYCQSGQIMSAAAFLATNTVPSDPDIDAAMAGNICRCGTYQRIRRAIHDAARRMPRWLATQAMAEEQLAQESAEQAQRPNTERGAIKYQAVESPARMPQGGKP